MRILYDHQIFSVQIFGGISRYFFELMNQFSAKGEPEYELAMRCSDNCYISATYAGRHKTFLGRSNFRGKYRLMSVLNRARSKKALLCQDFDVFHPTYYDPYFLKHIGGKPFVLTIHDMIQEIFPSDFSDQDMTSKNKRVLAQKAAKIIAVSESTKRDIVKYLGIDEGKITVIYHGNSLSGTFVGKPSDLSVPERYILFVGRRGKYKNFEFFIRSLSPLLYENTDLSVLCAGGTALTDSEIVLFKELRLEQRIKRLAVSDADLAYLYQKALFFVFPSLYEGFGIPLLEAMSCGCPVILSDIDVFKEVGGDAAVYFDPKSDISIRKAICTVAFNDDMRRDLRAKGFEQVKKYSWDRTADATAALYRSIL